MKNSEKGFVGTILIATVAIVLLVGIIYLYMGKSSNTPTSNTISTSTTIQKNNATLINEEASGYVKVKYAYTKNGKNYIDVDYVIFRHEKGDMPWGTKINENQKIRTFEVISDATIMLQNDYVNGVLTSGNYSINFDKFKNIISDSDDIRAQNPWNIVVKDGVVITIVENFRS